MQTSAKNLSAKQKKVVFNKLACLLADLSDPKEAEQFITSFFTETEQSVLTKRLAVLWLLEQGLSYEEISKQLHVSSATISSVAAMRDSEGFQIIKNKLKLDDWAENLVNKLANFLPS